MSLAKVFRFLVPTVWLAFSVSHARAMHDSSKVKSSFAEINGGKRLLRNRKLG